MKTRWFGSTGMRISEVGLGCWQLGGDWAHISHKEALAILEAGVDTGVTFFDTADVYGDGRSEAMIGQFLKQTGRNIFVATKVGRRNYPGPYTRDTLRLHIEDSLHRLDVEALDLVQLHCIPTEVMRQGDIFGWLREFQQAGKIKGFGASVESMAEALMIMDAPGLISLQIIFNIFRQKPIERVLALAKEREIAIIVRLPLASGLLTGKFTRQTTFAEDDHRNYNRDGEAFNVGETFAGLPFTRGIELADQIKPWIPGEMSMAQFALRWVLDHDAVTVVIPGASRPSQVRANAAVSDLSPLSPALHDKLRKFYREKVHDHIRGVY